MTGSNNNNGDDDDCRKCVQMLEQALTSSKNFKAARLLRSLNRNQPVQLHRRASGFTAHLHDGPLQFRCKRCSSVGPEGNARAFVMGPDEYSIVVCDRRVNTQEAMEQVVTHELMHMYDVHRLQLDLRNCSALAYTEVRAAREAECCGSQAHQARECVRSTATHATMNLFPWRGRGCVNSVLEQAMADERPFVAKRRLTKMATSPVQQSSSQFSSER